MEITGHLKRVFCIFLMVKSRVHTYLMYKYFIILSNLLAGYRPKDRKPPGPIELLHRVTPETERPKLDNTAAHAAEVRP